MRRVVLASVCCLLLTACGGDATPSAPTDDGFFFHSGGTDPIEGIGAWRVDAKRDGALLVETVKVGRIEGKFGDLSPSDRDALWAAIDGAGLHDLQVVERPGAPDEVRLTFRLEEDEETTREVEIWQNDVEELPALAPLLPILRRLIEERTGEKPGF